MSDSIVSIGELDLVVYGQVQYAFNVEGSDKTDLASALMMSTLKRATSTEHQIEAMSQFAKARLRKTQDLSTALAAIARVVSIMSGEDYSKDPSKKLASNKENDALVTQIRTYASPYNISYKDVDGSGAEKGVVSLEQCLANLTSGNAQKLQSAIRLALDKEQNALTRTNNSLQNFLSKRDSAFNMVAKLQKKIQKTENRVAQSIGS